SNSIQQKLAEYSWSKDKNYFSKTVKQTEKQLTGINGVLRILKDHESQCYPNYKVFLVLFD
ncbi:MAG: hypothetical protein ABI091_12880, partial [Ferruginibacter sp.]